LRLRPKSSQPVYKQVCEELKEAILTGRLKPGDKLPSTRDLADSAGISRFTVIRSYEELSSQGYIETISGSGTFVNHNLPQHLSSLEEAAGEVFAARPAVELSAFATRLLESDNIGQATAELFTELHYGGPTIDQLPLSRWREAVARCSRFEDSQSLSYVADPFGYAPLRKAIAGYLTRSRSIRCLPDQVALFYEGAGARDLIARLLLNPGDTVAVEDPGFPGARRTFLMHAAKIFPVRVDGEGLLVSHLEKHQGRIKLVYVTPSHHDPTGVVMSLPRRLELLRWADRTGAFIIEDDFDSEFRYGEKPVPSLQGLDENDETIYLSSFWKVLFPVVKLAYLVVPRRLTSVMSRAKSLIERDFSLLEQRALADFIDHGHLERHIKRMRVIYARRRASLVQALTRQFGKHVMMSDVSAGMHLLVTFPPRLAEERVLECAQQAHLPLVSTRNYYLTEPTAGEYLIGFAHADETQIRQAVETFAQAVKRGT